MPQNEQIQYWARVFGLGVVWFGDGDEIIARHWTSMGKDGWIVSIAMSSWPWGPSIEVFSDQGLWGLNVLHSTVEVYCWILLLYCICKHLLYIWPAVVETKWFTGDNGDNGDIWLWSMNWESHPRTEGLSASLSSCSLETVSRKSGAIS